MKQIFSIIIAALVGATAVFVLKSGNSPSNSEADNSELEQQIADLRKQLNVAKAQAGRVEVVETEREKIVEKLKEVSPEELIAELKLIQPSDENREKSMLEVNYYMTSLTKIGERSVPAIDTFLETSEDVEYSKDALNFRREGEEAKEAEARGEEGKGGARDFLRSGFGSYFLSNAFKNMKREFSPQSMRIGLFFVLHDIGGAKAEAVLAKVLDSTGRGLEVAFLDMILSEMAPDFYKNKVLEVTHDLLTSAPAATSSLFDEASRMVLFAILMKYKDATFVDTAKTMIVTPEGKVDGAVVNYLTTILGEKAVPLLYAKLKDDSLTDDGDKMALGDAVLKHVGTNDDSNAFFKEVVLNKELGPLRYLALGHLVGGDRSEDTLRSRQELIGSIKEDSDDEGLNRMLDGTNNRIEVMIDPSKAEELGGAGGGGGLEGLLNGLFNRGGEKKDN
ncbi:uncharacterized protein METZ01_LOCUS237469 [marine metagenome]|uniref:Uncharacterized protein n=1 Tax=marine metagenome TaxID=408172 RepID=A0A382HC09_9ZZZZ